VTPKLREYRETIHFDGYTELSPEQALAVMDAATYRITEKVETWPSTKPHTVTEVEIYHNGRWLDLCRTDLCDNVCTHFPKHWTLKQWLDHYKARIHFGARFSDRLFAVIDSVSDG
jgi:hypothetical protein